MSHIKLENALSRLDDWCAQHQVQYDVAVDESDMQGIIVFKKDKALLNQLFTYLQPVLESEGVYFQQNLVRGGAVIALSLLALSENRFKRIVSTIGESLEEQTFESKLHEIFNCSLVTTYTPPISETQYKPASKGITRANQTSLQRELLTKDATYAGDTEEEEQLEEDTQPEFMAVATIDIASADTPDDIMSGLKSADSGLPQPLSNDSCKEFKSDDDHAGEFADGEGSQPGMPVIDDSSFAEPATYEEYCATLDRLLSENLEGMATSTDHQPGQLFQRFSQALDVLGQQLHTGSIKGALDKQGIKWQESDDHLGIILYIMNATTNAPQPIGRISSETLDKPNEFSEQLLSMLDYAKGQAPGTTQQQQEELRNQEKIVRDVANSMHPEAQMQQQQPVPTVQLAGQAAPGQDSAQPQQGQPQQGQPGQPQGQPQAGPQGARPTRPQPSPTRSQPAQGRFGL